MAEMQIINRPYLHQSASLSRFAEMRNLTPEKSVLPCPCLERGRPQLSLRRFLRMKTSSENPSKPARPGSGTVVPKNKSSV